MDLQPGELFAGRDEVRRLLGSGDRKRTYLARDTKMRRSVALSLVKPEAAAADPEGTQREAAVLGHIGGHDNIVSIHDFDTSSGSVQFVVFEYLSGGTLSDYLRKTGLVPAGDILRFARQLCRGLSHLRVTARPAAPRAESPDRCGGAGQAARSAAVTSRMNLTAW